MMNFFFQVNVFLPYCCQKDFNFRSRKKTSYNSASMVYCVLSFKITNTSF